MAWKISPVWGRVGCAGLLVAAAWGIFYPVFDTVRNRARQLVCHGNMKQLMLGILQYAQDYDGKLPAVNRDEASVTWKTEIMPYVKSESVFMCRSRKDDIKGKDGLSISYAVNTTGVGRTDGKRGPFAPSTKTINLNHFSNAAQIIAFCEVTRTTSPGFDVDDPFFGPSRQVLYAGHEGWSSFAFLDGHVKSIAPLDTAHGAVTNGASETTMWYIDGSKPLSNNGLRILSSTENAFRDNDEGN